MWSTDKKMDNPFNVTAGPEEFRAAGLGNTADYIEKFGYDFVLPLLDFSPFLQVRGERLYAYCLKNNQSLSDVIREIDKGIIEKRKNKR